MRGFAVVLACGGCTGGTPKPDGIIVASDQQPIQIATDASDVYWTDGRGGVRKTPLHAPDSPPTMIVDRSMSLLPAAIALDGTSIYWSDEGDWLANNGFIKKVGLDGGTPVTLVPNIAGPIPGHLALDATRVLFTEDNVWAVSKLGGLLERIAIAEGGAEQIVVSGTHAYWSNSVLRAVRSVDLADLNAVPTTISAATGPSFLAVDASNVYWIDGGGPLEVAVMRAPLEGGSAMIVDRRATPNGGSGGGISVDGGFVYWSSETEIIRVGIDGTGSTTLAANNVQIHAMALGADDVYWEANQQIDTPQGGLLTTALRRIPK